jgi:hypothetical protein
MSWFVKPKVKTNIEDLRQTLNETKETFTKRLEFLGKDVENGKAAAKGLFQKKRKMGFVYLLYVMFIIVF